jgi:hypothetical protein
VSTRTAYVITCDEPGCDAEYVGSGFESKGNARSAAGGNHWRQRRANATEDRPQWLDICPDHRQDGDA